VAITAHEYICMLCAGDLHVPDHDEAAFDAACAFARKLKPDLLFITGDMWGCSNFGRWKHKTPPQERMRSGGQVKLARQLIGGLVDAAGADAHTVKSNHEDRVRKDIWGTSPETWTLDDVRDAASIPRLLGYTEFGVHWHGDEWWPRPWLLCQHGEAANKWAGTTVRKEMTERVGTAMVMGHTHRLCALPVTQSVGILRGVECGCLCKNPPDYGEGRTQDWQQGVVVAWIHKRRPEVHFEPCDIDDGVLFHGGKEYRG